MKIKEECERYRVMSGVFGTANSYTCGFFLLPSEAGGGMGGIAEYRSYEFKILAYDGTTDGWEHVSVSLPNRCPNWQEMSYIKDLFWDEEDCVIQFHVPKSQHVNNHPYCLHLWKKRDSVFETPNPLTVGMFVRGSTGVQG